MLQGTIARRESSSVDSSGKSGGSLCAKIAETTTSSFITVEGEEVQENGSHGEQWFAGARSSGEGPASAVRGGLQVADFGGGGAVRRGGPARPVAVPRRAVLVPLDNMAEARRPGRPGRAGAQEAWPQAPV